jgi:hypothetical protein
VADATVLVSLHEPHPRVNVPEALVQDLWHGQQFDRAGLSTTDGAPVRTYNPGRLNTDAGPDFLDAHLRIGGLEWRGAVEVHTTSAEWAAHEHAADPRYDSVVLHVTLHADAWTGRLERHDGTPLPEVVLAPRLRAPLRSLLTAFHRRSDPHGLPCAGRWADVPGALKQAWIHDLGHRRADLRRTRVRGRPGPLERRLYERLMTGLGYAKNDDAMALLAERVPLALLRGLEATRDREALLIGAAGLLPAPGDLLEADRATADYAMGLRARWQQLQARHALSSLEPTLWTFFRLRPQNFPPLRLAQAAAWFGADGLLRDRPVERLRTAAASGSPRRALRGLLRAPVADFWRTHYRLATASAEHDPTLGRSRIDTLLVNAVVPVLEADAADRGAPADGERARALLGRLPAGRDHVARRFRDLGTPARNALEAQGVHRLYRRYCRRGGCLRCRIGRHLLSGGASPDDDPPEA